MRTVPTILRKAIGSELFEKVSKSPAAFAAAFDGGLQPWDYQIEALEGAATLDPDNPEKFLHRWAVVSLPRQDGKSTLSAWYASWRFFTDETLDLIISVALDRQSALIILNEARRIIQHNEILNSLIDPAWGMTKNSIRLLDGAEWTIRPAQSQFSRGYRPGLICFDELGFSGDDGDLLQTLSAGQAAQERPQVFITSTVNLPTGPLWEFFERERKGDQGVYLYYRQYNQSPRISKEYLQEQRESLPPSIYSREHLNTWSSGLDAFTDAGKLDAAMSGPTPLLNVFDGRAFCYVDLSWRRDESVAAISRINDNGICEIIGLQIWTPHDGNDLDLEQVQEELQELAYSLSVRVIRVESPQGVMFSQTLRVPGAVVDSVHPTPQHQREVWGSLYNALRDERVRLPQDRKLRQQLLGLTIKSSESGIWRVEEIDRKLHQDRAMAVAGAVWLATAGRTIGKTGGLFLQHGFSGPITNARGENVEERIVEIKEEKKKRLMRWRSSKSEFSSAQTKSTLKKVSEGRWARIRGLKGSGDFPDHTLRKQFTLTHDELALVLVYPTRQDWLDSKDLN